MLRLELSLVLKEISQELRGFLSFPKGREGGREGGRKGGKEGKREDFDTKTCFVSARIL